MAGGDNVKEFPVGIPWGGEGKWESEAASPMLMVLSAMPETIVPELVARLCRAICSSSCDMT